MLIRLCSDLHCELVAPECYSDHFNYILPPLPQDAETVLVLAGDLFSLKNPDTYKPLIEYVKDRFKAIVLIFGNHEWYGGTIPKASIDFLEYIKPFKNIHYLDADNVFIDDVEFIGATLWTDFNKGDIGTMQCSHTYMNDYNYIRMDKPVRYITPKDLLKIHKKELKAITDLLKVDNGYKKVVITHMGCSMKSVHPRYENAGLSNYSFTSDLESLILEYQPQFWIHGHTHESLSYNINNTKVIVNPVGYRHHYVNAYENPDFNRDLVLEI